MRFARYRGQTMYFSKHAFIRSNKNGAMRFLCIDAFGLRIQASAVRCRKSQTTPIHAATLLSAARIIGAAVAVMHVCVTLCGV